MQRVFGCVERDRTVGAKEQLIEMGVPIFVSGKRFTPGSPRRRPHRPPRHAEPTRTLQRSGQ